MRGLLLFLISMVLMMAMKRDGQLIFKSFHNCSFVFLVFCACCPPSCGPLPTVDADGTPI